MGDVIDLATPSRFSLTNIAIHAPSFWDVVEEKRGEMETRPYAEEGLEKPINKPCETGETKPARIAITAAESARESKEHHDGQDEQQDRVGKDSEHIEDALDDESTGVQGRMGKAYEGRNVTHRLEDEGYEGEKHGDGDGGKHGRWCIAVVVINQMSKAQ